MGRKKNNLILLFLLFCIIAVVVSLVLLLYKKKENLCLCNGLGMERCEDREVSQKLYNDGWTEYTDLSKLSPPSWNKSSCNTCASKSKVFV